MTPRVYKATIELLYRDLGRVRATGASLVALEAVYARLGRLLERLARPMDPMNPWPSVLNDEERP